MQREYGIIAARNADWVHTVEAGEIVKSWTHEELLEQKREYAELYTLLSEGLDGTLYRWDYSKVSKGDRESWSSAHKREIPRSYMWVSESRTASQE
jgi:hypothetical protein